eukprot:gene9130-10707_t
MGWCQFEPLMRKSAFRFFGPAKLKWPNGNALFQHVSTSGFADVVLVGVLFVGALQVDYNSYRQHYEDDHRDNPLKYWDAYVKETTAFLEAHNHTFDDAHQGYKHTCIHDKMPSNEVPTSKNIDVIPSGRKLMAADAVTSHPMNIAFNTDNLAFGVERMTCYTVGQKVQVGGGTSLGDCSVVKAEPCMQTCKAEDIVSQSFVNLVTNTLLPMISAKFSDMLYVTGPDSYTIDDNYCGYLPMNPNLATTGFKGDLLLYISAHPIPGVGIAAYAANCHTTSNGRPISGYINFNPNVVARLLTKPTGFAFNNFINTALHELLHVVVMSKNHYANFKNPLTGLPYPNGASKLVKVAGTTPSGQPYTIDRTYITTPAVLAFGKSHYGCNNMIGVELENLGISAGGHWNPTTVGEELMDSYGGGSDGKLSNLTLSILYDSGWYGVNTKHAQPLNWGRGMGCGFFKCSKDTWNAQNYWDESENFKFGCSATRTGVGMTYWDQLDTSVPLPFQYWTDPYMAGYGDNINYCLASQIQVSVLPGSSYYCANENVNANTDNLEVVGASSACFEVVPTKGSKNYACYAKRCNGQSLEIQVGSSWYNCPAGTTVTTSSGIKLLCPSSQYKPCVPDIAIIPVPTGLTPTPTPTVTPKPTTPTPTPTPTVTPKPTTPTPTPTVTPKPTTPTPTPTVTPKPTTPTPTPTVTPKPTTPTPSPTVTPKPTTPTPTPTPTVTSKPSSIKFQQSVSSQWGSGSSTTVQVSGTVTNTGSSSVSNPKFISSPSSVTINGMWGLEPSTVNGQTVWSLPSWSTTLGAGQSVGFGYSCVNPTPVTFTQI